MALTPALIAAYQKADYVVFGDPDLVLRVGEKNARLDYLVDWLGRKTAAFVTAVNPRGGRRPEDDNRRAMEALYGSQFEAGTTIMPGEARDLDGVWPVEPSLLIVGIARAEAEALGRRFGQNAIVFVDKGRAPELVLLA